MSPGFAAMIVILGGALVVTAFAICGHLGRIADAVEAQNKHYGIGRERPVIVNRDEAA